MDDSHPDLRPRQVQSGGAAKGQYQGVWKSLVRMWKEEGFKGFMRGNGINCVRIIPYSAVQFTTVCKIPLYLWNISLIAPINLV
jgi:hypothetical protein